MKRSVKLQTFNGWAVGQKSSAIRPEDVFFVFSDAVEYKRNCFEPEHKAVLIPVTIEIKTRAGRTNGGRK